MLAKLKLKDKIRYGEEKEPELAPEDSGLNIEGLAATPEGELLIGLRNPLSGDKRTNSRAYDQPNKGLKRGLETGIHGAYTC